MLSDVLSLFFSLCLKVESVLQRVDGAAKFRFPASADSVGKIRRSNIYNIHPSALACLPVYCVSF